MGDIDVFSDYYIYLDDHVTAGGNLTITADSAAGDVGEIDAEYALEAISGDIGIFSDYYIYLGDTVTAGGNLTVAADSDTVDAGMVYALDTLNAISGNVDISSDSLIDLYGNVTAGGNLALNGDLDNTGSGNVTVRQNLISQTGNIEIYSSDTATTLYGDVTADVDVLLNNNTVFKSTANQSVTATTGTLTAKNNLTKTLNGNLTLSGATAIDIDGTVDVQAGSLQIENAFSAAGNLIASTNVTLDGAATLDGTSGQRIDAGTGTLWAKNMITKTGAGKLTLSGATAIDLDGTVDVDAGALQIEDAFNAAGDLIASADVTLDAAATLDGTVDQGIGAEAGTLTANGTITKTTAGNLYLTATAGNVVIDDGMTLTSLGALTVAAGENVTLGGAVQAVGNLTLNADADLSGSGTMWAKSTVTTTAGSIDISASDSTIVLDNNVDAAVDLLLNNNTEVAAGKTLRAGNNITVGDNKTLTGNGALTINAGQTATFGGDVETLAGELKITGGSAGLAVDIKGAVNVTGGNADIEGTGDVQVGGDVASNVGGVSIVSNDGKIYTRDSVNDDTVKVNISGNSDDLAGIGIGAAGGKTAILIKSKDDLKLDSGTLTANGVYYDTVDDRGAVDFLAVDIPAEDKLAGDAIDVAIYLASTDGDVQLGSAIGAIGSDGVVVADASGAVSYGAGFEASLTAGNIGHLEVSSRSASNYANARNNSLLVEEDSSWDVENYVWRGENPDVGTGAWVLVKQAESVPAAPVPVIRVSEVELAEFEVLGIALLLAATEELGISVEDIQVSLDNAAFLNTDVRPYDILERLIAAADVLQDNEGIEAFGRVINEFAMAPMAATEEQMASIASALSNPDSGTHYVKAGEFIDAMVSYIGILNEELGWSQSNAVSFVTEKYGTTLSETDNASLAAFVQLRLANLGG